MNTGLERILRLKEELLDRAVRRLEATRQEIRALEEGIAAARHELAELKAEGREISSADLMVIHGAKEALRHRIEELETELGRLKSLENQQESEVKRLYEDKEKIRRIHERRARELERELQRKEARRMDEFALRSKPERR